MLKMAQFALSHLGSHSSRQIEAVFLNDPNAELKFNRFFGESHVTVHQGGLEGYLTYHGM